MGWPVSASHNRTVLSPLAEARRCPSGLNATSNTWPVCPVSGAPIGWPVSAFHNRTVWSRLAEARRCPSGLIAALIQWGVGVDDFEGVGPHIQRVQQ